MTFLFGLKVSIKMIDMSIWLNLEFLSMALTIVVFIWVVVKARKRKYAYGGMNSIEFTVNNTEKKNESKFENKCRVIFEKLFNKRFISCRPAWLKNPITGRNLELDGFCESISTPLGRGIAFESDGAQHAQYSRAFHRSEKEFLYQVKKDSFKSKKCIERGILLIRIPHFVTGGDIEPYIVKQLTKNGVPIPNPPATEAHAEATSSKKKRKSKKEIVVPEGELDDPIGDIDAIDELTPDEPYEDELAD
jgi:hypothetical protein